MYRCPMEGTAGKSPACQVTRNVASFEYRGSQPFGIPQGLIPIVLLYVYIDMELFRGLHSGRAERSQKNHYGI